MAQVVVAALVKIGTAIVATVGAAGVYSTATLAFIGAATIAVGVASLRMLTPDLRMPQSDNDQSRQSTVRGTIEPQKIVYGEALVSGPIFFVGTANTDNKDLYHGIALTGHECEAITDIYLDNEIITNAQITNNLVTGGTFGPVDSETICQVEKKLGTATQASSSLLTTGFTEWTSAHQGKSLSYIVTKFTLTDGSQELWDRLTPTNIKALVKGKNDIYDPRLDVAAGNAAGDNPASATYQAWSDNPALCVANFLMDTEFGLGVPASKIDWADVVTSADACDVSVVVPNSGTQKRFTANGVIFATDSYRASLDKLLSSMNGSIFYSNGSYRIKAGVYEAPALTLDADDLAGAITVKTSVERGERFNTIRPIIVDPAQNHKSTEAPQVQLTSAVSRDNGEVITKDIQLPFTNTSFMAQRLSHKQIQLSDQQKVISFPANLSALNVDIGDRVSVTIDELNYSAKVFRCLGWSFADSADGAVNLTLLEDDAGSYADPTAGEYSTVTADGTITPGFRGVPDPQNLSATAGLKNIELNWTNPVNTSKFKEIVIYASPDSAWTNAVEIGRTLGTQFFHDASNGADPIAVGNERYYWIRAVAYGTGSGSFVESDRNPDNDVSTISATVGPNNPDYSDIVDNTPAQAAPTALTLTETTALGNDGSVLPAVLVSWTAPTPNTYVSFYELEWKRTSVGEIDLGDVADGYTSTIDYGSVADATTIELNYGGVNEAVVGGDTVYSNIAVYGTNTTIAGLVELQEYTFRVRAVTLTGKTSGTITNTLVLQGDNTPPGIPGAVTATGGIQQITLNWENPSDSDFAFVEIFESTTNNLNSASLIIQTPSDNHTIAGLANNVTRYYWLRTADRSGNFSGFTASFNATTVKVVPDDLAQSVLDLFAEGDAFGIEPVSTLSGVTGDHVGQIKYLTTTSELYVWNGTAWTTDLFTASSVDPGSITAASFATGVEPISSVSSLPSPTGYTGPKTVFLTSDAKLYRYNASVPEFTAALPTSDFTGTLPASVFDSSLRPVEVVNSLPTTGNFQGRLAFLTTDNKQYRYTGTSWTKNIFAADLGDQLNMATQVFGQLRVGNLDVNNVFADSAVIGAIQASSITTAAVVAAIGDFEYISSSNIESNAITGGKIAASTIDASKLNVTNLAAISANLGAVTAGSINASTVTISNLNGSNVTTGTVPVARLDVNGIISAGGIIVSGSNISSLTNNSGYVDSSGAAAAAPVQSVAGATGAVSVSTIINAGSIVVTGANISTLTNNSGYINGSQVNTNVTSISGGVITTGTINANRINIDNVTLDTDGAGQLIIHSAGVNTAQLAANSVTNAQADSTNGIQNFTGSSSSWIFRQIASVTLTSATGGPIQLFGRFQARSYDDQCLCYYRIKRGSTTLLTSQPAAVRPYPEGISFPIGYLDESGPTGSVTYTIEAAMNDQQQNYIDTYLLAMETKR